MSTTKQESFRDKMIRKGMTSCRHFTGIQHETCKAGVNYERLRGETHSLPCLANFVNLGRLPKAECGKFATLTEEEATREADELVQTQQSSRLAMTAAHADAKSKGLGKGKGGVSSLPCPIPNCKGTLQYSVASYNGHMHARCNTGTCVSWME